MDDTRVRARRRPPPRPLMDGEPLVPAPSPRVPGRLVWGHRVPAAVVGWRVPRPVNAERMALTSLSKHKWPLSIPAGRPEEAESPGSPATDQPVQLQCVS